MGGSRLDVGVQRLHVLGVRLGFLFLTLMIWGCGGSTPEPKVTPGAMGLISGDILGYRIMEPDGRVSGRLRSRFQEDGGRLQVITRGAFGAPVDDLERLVVTKTVEQQVVMDVDFSPVSFRRLSSESGRMELIFEADTIRKITDREVRALPRSNPTGILWSDVDPTLLAVLVQRQKPGSSLSMSMFMVETGRRVKWPIQFFADAQRRTQVKLPWGTATLDERGYVAHLRLEDGRIMERIAPGPKLGLLPMPEVLRYVRPSLARWVDRPAQIDVEDGQLAGTLSVPRQAARWPRSLAPGVVFVSDLGPHDRHGFSGALDVGTWRIFDRLTEEGFAVLRQDDRGVGASKTRVPASAAGLSIRRGDVQAAIAFLRRQPGVDPDRIFVVAHGFGSGAAVEAARAEEPCGLILWGPAFRKPQAILAERGVNLPLGHDEAYLRDLEAYDMKVSLHEVSAPVVVFQGLRDIEVSWRADAQALIDHVNGRRRRHARLFVYELVDHWLKTESGRSSLESYRDRNRPIDGELLDDLVTWMVDRAKAVRP